MHTPDSLFDYRHPQAGGCLRREMLQAQLEVATRPHLSSLHAREELLELRNAAARSTAEHGLRILASGTHPTADWREFGSRVRKSAIRA